MEQDNDVCAIPGPESEGLTVGKMNNWLRVFLLKTMNPLKQGLADNSRVLKSTQIQVSEFIRQDIETHARIEGSLKAIKIIWPGIVAIVGTLLAALLAIGLSYVKEIRDDVRIGILPVAAERIERLKAENQRTRERLDRIEHNQQRRGEKAQ